jgi:hypothetical protein
MALQDALYRAAEAPVDVDVDALLRRLARDLPEQLVDEVAALVRVAATHAAPVPYWPVLS